MRFAPPFVDEIYIIYCRVYFFSYFPVQTRARAQYTTSHFTCNVSRFANSIALVARPPLVYAQYICIVYIYIYIYTNPFERKRFTVWSAIFSPFCIYRPIARKRFTIYVYKYASLCIILSYNTTFDDFPIKEKSLVFWSWCDCCSCNSNTSYYEDFNFNKYKLIHI